MPAPPVTVFKFGGSSVGTPERFLRMIDVIRGTAKEGRVVVVVSALSMVTRQLSGGLETFTTEDGGAEGLSALVRTLRARHRDHAAAVLSRESAAAYDELLEARLQHLQSAFADVERTGFSARARDAILAAGEQMSVPIATLALRDVGLSAPHTDATALVATDATYGEANVRLPETTQRVRDWYAGLSVADVPVVAGFIGSGPDGQTTTLGFEGSDYSAALLAQILGAGCLARYTDVDALYSDDPSTNADAERLDVVAMDRAYAWTESGRLGMHPKTLRPLVEAGIPMQVRCIDTPDVPGTQILPDGVASAGLIPRV